MNQFFKKVDISVLLDSKITIPRDNEEMFLQGEEIPPSTSRTIELIFKGKKYDAKIAHVNRSESPNVYQIIWKTDKDLQLELKKEFVQSYIAIMSDKYRKQQMSNKKYYTHLKGGQQEVIKFTEIDKCKYKMETYIKIETPYDLLFQKLIENNVFSWITNKEEEAKIIIKETKWKNISELKEHEDAKLVIYYLVDENNKEIYIGSAKRLGDRVKPGRAEIPGWNKFRYEIIDPKYSNILKQLEYHSICNFGRFFDNEKLENLNVSEYKLVNRDFGYYRQ